MSVVTLEWLIVFLGMLLFVGVIVADIFWLIKKGWASAGRATAFVLITDIIGCIAGTVIVMTIVLIAFMMVMGPAGTGSNVPEWAYVLCIILAIIIPPFVLIGLKRLFLRVLKIGIGKSAWLYSIVSSILTIFVVLVPPPLVFYILTGPLGIK